MLRIFSTRTKRVLVTIVAIGALALPAPAHAHFILDQPILPGEPACWMSEDPVSGAPQKLAPCGNEGGGTPTETVTAFQSGQTISMTINEVVTHSGWYRVALVQGPSSTQTIQSLPDPPGTTCSPTIVSNPIWSPTQPVVVDGVPHGSQTMNVTLPQDATCGSATPCTLQVIEVMTDHAYPSCYYHHCADITIASADVDGGGSGLSSGASDAVGADASQDSNAQGGSTSSRGPTGGFPEAGGASGGSGGVAAADVSTTPATPSSRGFSCLIARSDGIPGVAGLAGLVAVTAIRRRRRQA